ncbi:MAG: hypothetical protein ACRD17_14600 [Terriglobales bacterium]
MKILKSVLCTASAALVLAGLALAATPGPNSRRIAWIDPASPYASYLEAAIQKKHVPVEFTVKKKAADLLVTIEGQNRNGSTWRAVLTGNSGRASSLSMSVINQQSGIIIFSYTCHKGGHGIGFGHHQGLQSAAECLAKHWGDFLKKQGR